MTPHTDQQRWRTRLVQQWKSLAHRERRALTALAVVLGVLLFLVSVIEPSFEYVARARRYAEAQAALLAYVQHHAPATERTANPAAPRLEHSLLATVNITAGEFGLSFQDLQPDGNTRLSLSLDHGEFDRLIAWIDTLTSRYGIQVARIAVQRTSESGRVSARLVLYVEATTPGDEPLSRTP